METQARRIMAYNNIWILNIGSIKSVPIRIHGTFLIFFAWILYSSGGNFIQNCFVGGYVISIFGCVLLHELGHVFTASFYKIKTRDITLYPFGGIAMLLDKPNSIQELSIAIAGPCINGLIALVLFIFLKLIAEFQIIFAYDEDLKFFIHELLKANIYIGAFNLVPALPMDGGRVFRSILEIFKVENATKIAGRVSQIFSVLMAIIGIITASPILTIIAVFVFLNAANEMLSTHTHLAGVGFTAKDLLIERDKLYEFHHGTVLSDAIKIAIKTNQEYFPVIFNDELMGVAEKDTLISEITTNSQAQYVSAIMNRNFVSIQQKLSLNDTLQKASETDAQVLMVFDEDKFIGILYTKYISECMVIRILKEDQQKLDEEFNDLL